MPPDHGARHFLDMFNDPAAVARYHDGPRRYVPGLDDLHRMAGILLAERAPRDARILVLGAGGGLELTALAKAHPGWHFVGVDPAEEMLRLAARTLGPLAARVEFVRGYIEDAPAGPFDGAACLLTLHFLDAAGRQRTAGEIRRRLRPGAALVAAHATLPPAPQDRRRWLSRYAAFAVASGAPPAEAEKARAAVDANLNLLPPEQDEATLHAAGFRDIEPFYAAFTWRGWVATA